MNESFIFCDISIFDLEQSIYLTTNNCTKKLYSCKIEQLYEAIVQACYENCAFKVRISGNSQYNDVIVNDILSYNAKHYNNNNNIEVEVVK